MSLEACVAACRELLIDEPELLADFSAVFAGLRPRWERMPDDLRHGLADVAWDHLVGRGLAPAAGERCFVLRSEQRCRVCGRTPDPEYHRCPDCQGTGRVLHERRSTHPPSLCVVLALAADAAGMLAAEALAREAATRLWPWGGRRGADGPPRPIAWRVDERGEALELRRGTRNLCPLLFEALTCVARDRRRHGLSSELYPEALDHMSSGDHLWPPKPAVDRAAGSLYAELAADRTPVPTVGLHGPMPSTRDGWPFPPHGRTFAEFADPFTPLCELWDRGIAIERIEADAIVLARSL
jgi:hypothetical protein